MPVYKLDEIDEELVTPKHSSALGRLVTGEQIELGLLRFKTIEDTEVVSGKGIVGGVGHRI